jgi:hypothetical protein
MAGRTQPSATSPRSDVQAKAGTRQPEAAARTRQGGPIKWRATARVGSTATRRTVVASLLRVWKKILQVFLLLLAAAPGLCLAMAAKPFLLGERVLLLGILLAFALPVAIAFAVRIRNERGRSP